MTVQATPFRTIPDQKPSQSGGRVTQHLVAMLIVGSAGAVLASRFVDTSIPPAWLGLVLAASLLVAGLSLMRASAHLAPEEARAWSPVSYAVIAAALGQALWATIGGVVSFGDDAPAATDVFHIAFYALMSLGLLRMPFVRSSRVGTFRMAMDVLVGLVAAATLMVELRDDPFSDGVLSPVLHIILLAAMLVSFLRRSPYVFDTRLALLLGGLIPTVLATELGPRGTASALMLLWAVTAVFLGFLSVQLRRPLARQNLILARPGRKRLLLPHLPAAGVGVLFAARVATGQDLTNGALPWGMLLLAAAIVARSWASGRESRQLLALERDQLLASISHELRTPLTVVAGFSDVLSSSWETLPEPERREMLDMVRAGSTSLVDIVSDMASLARSELDAVQLDLQRISGKTLIADAIRLVFNIDGPLPIRAEVEPYLEVVADHRRMVQVLRALFENALRYGNGKILVVAKRGKVGRVIEVHDNGSGVPSRYEKVIWERFERGEHELNAKVPGSGLGLAVVRSIVRAHGGETRYRPSERLGGACFVIELPYDSDTEVRRSVG